VPNFSRSRFASGQGLATKKKGEKLIQHRKNAKIAKIKAKNM
jgi:hypothetical protein